LCKQPGLSCLYHVNKQIILPVCRHCDVFYQCDFNVFNVNIISECHVLGYCVILGCIWQLCYNWTLTVHHCSPLIPLNQTDFLCEPPILSY
jgi:hypothetical protein